MNINPLQGFIFAPNLAHVSGGSNTAIYQTSGARSSPPVFPPSSQGDVDITSGLFEFAGEQQYWQSRTIDLARIREILVDNKDLSLRQMYEITEEKWISSGLKDGQHKRFVDTVKKYSQSVDFVAEISD